jgi:hypothetical protein
MLTAPQIPCILDIWRNILMQVAMYESFPRNPAILRNSNWSDYPSVFIVCYHPFTILNLFIVYPNSPTYTDCNTYCEFGRCRTLKVKVFTWYCLIDCQCSCRILKHWNIVKIECLSCWNMSFRDLDLSTNRNNLSFNPFNFDCCHSPRFQLCLSKICRFFNTLTSLCHEVISLTPDKEEECASMKVVIYSGNKNRSITSNSICRTLSDW